MPTVPKEVVLEQYQLRSTFFTEKLDEFGFFEFANKIGKIIQNQGNTFSWNDKVSWGITNDAWVKIENSTIHPLIVFCHPRIIRQHPKLLRYYRSIALLPQKGLQKIAFVGNLKEIEAGTKQLTEKKLNNVVLALNEFMSSIISLTSEMNQEKIDGMMYATAGTTIDGSWRNQIGTEGERVIRSVLVKYIIHNNEIIAFADKNDISYSLQEWKDTFGDPVSSINLMKSVITSNGSSLIFASEPDVTFINSDGTIIGAMEIKAGIDPAGALERLGAMFKSFDNVLSVTPDATTILVATCITDEVESRLRESNTVSQIFITTDIINNKAGKALKLVNAVRAILGLTQKRL